MNKFIIKVPTGIRFISDVPEIKTAYNREIIQQYYNNGVKLKAKATDVKKYFDVKTTTDAKAEGCFKIIKKL